MARWKYAVVGLVVVPMLLVGLFVGWVWAAFSGGVDDLLDFDHPQPGDAEVVAAEREAQGTHGEMSDEVVAALAEALGPSGAVEVGRGVAPGRCVVGQHNFKIDDDFDLSCELRGVQVVTAPTVSADAVRRLDEVLQSEGWGRSGLYDAEQPVRSSSTDVGELLPLRYTRQHEGATWRLVVDQADLSSMTYELQGLDGLRDETGRAVTVEELVGATQPGGDDLAVGVGVEYFRD